jgi:hypothetical protein
VAAGLILLCLHFDTRFRPLNLIRLNFLIIIREQQNQTANQTCGWVGAASLPSAPTAPPAPSPPAPLTPSFYAAVFSYAALGLAAGAVCALLAAYVWWKIMRLDGGGAAVDRYPNIGMHFGRLHSLSKFMFFLFFFPRSHTDASRVHNHAMQMDICQRVLTMTTTDGQCPPLACFRALAVRASKPRFRPRIRRFSSLRTRMWTTAFDGKCRDCFFTRTCTIHNSCNIYMYSIHFSVNRCTAASI